MADDQSPGKVAGAVAVTKDVFSLLRDAFVFFGLVMLLLFPATLNRTLNNAGIVEMNTGFAVWKNSLVSTDAQLKVANDTITSLRASQDRLLAALAQQPSGPTNLAQQNAITVVRDGIRTRSTP